MGLDLKNPLIVSSSGITGSIGGIRKCEEAGAGAVVLKSMFEELIIAGADNLERSLSNPNIRRRTNISAPVSRCSSALGPT